jgi:steroid 5-alpha reductase family enzyme
MNEKFLILLFKFLFLVFFVFFMAQKFRHWIRRVCVRFYFKYRSFLLFFIAIFIGFYLSTFFPTSPPCFDPTLSTSKSNPSSLHESTVSSYLTQNLDSQIPPKDLLIWPFFSLEWHFAPYTVLVAMSLILFHFIFFLSLQKDNMGFWKVTWGVFISLISLVETVMYGQGVLRSKLLLLLSLIWGCRSSYFMYCRYSLRYDNILTREVRSETQMIRDSGSHYFGSKAYFSIYMTCILPQSGLLCLVMVPLVNVLTLQEQTPMWRVFDIIGLVCWLIGFYFEARCDWVLLLHQKRQFHHAQTHHQSATPTTPIPMNDLWQYCQNPHLLGVSLVWLGLYFFNLSTVTFPFSEEIIFIQIFAFVSILLQFIILFLAAQNNSKNIPNYDPNIRTYLQTTPIFVPHLTPIFKI